MSSTTPDTGAGASSTSPAASATQATYSRAPIPLGRVISVEFRKMFDTRSGFWLMAAIGITALLATIAVVLFAPDDALEYSSFATAIGVPMNILLPIVAILSVTGEWSQRTGLATFTYVPHRGRVIGAKAICAILVGVVSIVIAGVIGALGNLVGAGVNGISPVWDVTVDQLLRIVLANVLSLLVGFMLGVLIRNSAGAIVGYFVYSFVIPTISGVLAATQDWWKSAQPWLDFNNTQGQLFNDQGLTGTEWLQLLLTGLLWLGLPLAIGLVYVFRSEVK